MNKIEEAVLNCLNDEGVEIYCTPAIIRKCNGFIIETVTKQPERATIFKVLNMLKDNGYNIYSLRHNDTDWSQPRYVTKKSILANRFGWFISKDEMEFSPFVPEVRLSTRTVKYYCFENDIIVSTNFYLFNNVDLNYYFNNFK